MNKKEKFIQDLIPLLDKVINSGINTNFIKYLLKNSNLIK